MHLWVCVFVRCVRVRLDEFGPMCALLCEFVPICIANYFHRNSHGTRYFSLRFFFHRLFPLSLLVLLVLLLLLSFICVIFSWNIYFSFSHILILTHSKKEAIFTKRNFSVLFLLDNFYLILFRFTGFY